MTSVLMRLLLLAPLLAGCASTTPRIGNGRCEWERMPTIELAAEEIILDCTSP